MGLYGHPKERANGLRPMVADARCHLALAGRSDELLDASQTLCSLAPVGHELFACPVAACEWGSPQGESRGRCATHLVGDHFTLVKAHAAVLAQMQQHSDASGQCPFNPSCKLSSNQGGWANTWDRLNRDCRISLQPTYMLGIC